MRLGIGLAVTLLLALALVRTAAAESESARDCQDLDRPADRRIADCTAALAESGVGREEKAWLFDARGWSHDERAEYADAERDFSAAIAEASFSDRLLLTLQATIKDPAAVDRTDPFGAAFFSRSWTRSRLGRYDDAIADAKTAANWSQSSATDAVSIGAIAWAERLRGDSVAAEEDYKKSLAMPAHPPIIAFIYATMLFDQDREAEGLEQLHQSVLSGDREGYPSFWLFLRTPDERDRQAILARYLNDARVWPEPIGRYFLGTISENDLLREAQAGATPLKIRENLCEAHYYIAEALRRTGKPDEARPHYQAAVDTGIVWFVEYMSAKHRLGKD